jgi:hypothetical protein
MSPNKELLSECLEIYNDDIDALTLHLYSLHIKFNKTTSKTVIYDDLLDGGIKLDKYRLFFLKVCESLQSEIESYKKMVKFDIQACHAPLLYCYDNIDFVNELDTHKKNKLKRELIQISFYAERLLNEVI